MRDLLAVVVVSLILVASFPMTVVAQIEKSETTVGDRWTFDFEMKYEGFIMTGDVEVTVKGTTELLGYDVYILSMEGDGSLTGVASGTWEITLTLYKRISDHATVKSEGTTVLTYLYLDNIVTLSTEREETNNPPLDFDDFPIELHETWTASTSRTTTAVMRIDDVEQSRDTETETVVYTIECLRERTVTVPAGTFTGYEIKLTRDDGSYTIDVVSSTVGASVRSEDFESDGTKIGTMELVSYDIGLKGEGLGSLELSLIIAVLVIVIVVVVVVATAVASKRKRRMEEQPPVWEQREEPPPSW